MGCEIALSLPVTVFLGMVFPLFVLSVWSHAYDLKWKKGNCPFPNMSSLVYFLSVRCGIMFSLSII